MADLNVTVDTSAVDATVQQLQERLMPMSLAGFMTGVAHPILRKRAEERFAAGGDEASGAWAQLTFATGKIRMYQGYSPFWPINVRTGELKNFVETSFTVDEKAGGVVMTLPGEGSATQMSKFLVAQQGGAGRMRSQQGPNRPTPARPVLALGEIDSVEIQHGLLDWIREGIF